MIPKFRAWDKEYNFMYKVMRVEFENGRTYAWRDALPGEFAMHIGRLVGKEAELMQYTGLKDKNGKEIYEGDIVSTDLSRPYLIVEFRNGAFMYQCHHGGQDFYDHMEPAFEDEREYTKYHAVVGNIHENPELLI